jgi:O-antigen/teichoic acid export membrane protein
MAGFPRLLLNSISGATLLVVQIVLAFVFTPFIVEQLGNHDYGIWELLLGLVGYLGILDMGVTPAVVRFVAHAEGRDDRSDLNRVFNTCLVTMVALGTAGIIVMSVAAIWANQILGVDSHQDVRASLLFVLFGASFLVSFVMSAFSAYLLGMQRHWLVNSVRVVLAVLQFTGLWWVLISPQWGSMELIAMCVVVIAVNLLEIALLGTAVLGFGGLVRLEPRQFSWSTARQMFVFGAKNTLIMAAWTLLGRGILFVVAHLVSVAAVAFYLIPGRLVSYASSAIAAIGFPMTPFFASLAGRSGIAGQREVWFPLTRALQFIGIGMQLALLWLGVEFLRLWMGDEYANQGRGVLLILCAASLFGCLAPNGNRVLMSLGRHGQLAKLSAVFSLCALALSVPLTRRFGIDGAALALGLFMAAQSTAEMLLSCRMLEIALLEHLRTTVFRYVLPAAACCAAFFLTAQTMTDESYADLALHGLIAGSVWVIAGIAFGLTAEDRGAVLSWFKARRAHP